VLRFEWAKKLRLSCKMKERSTEEVEILIREELFPSYTGKLDGM
jgi:hypothetical protein